MTKIDDFTKKVKVEDMVAQASRQMKALQGTGATRVEWRVADQQVVEALRKLFKTEKLSITVVHVP